MEEYQKIPNSKYEINKLGDIRRIYKNGNVSYLTPWINQGGYKMVVIDNRKRMLVHRLLGLMFIENDDPLNKTIIDHIDRDRSNNDLNNLRWVSCIENNNNIEQGHGCISKCLDKIKHKEVTYYYTWYRVFYRKIGVGNKRHSKRFKKEEDAIEYLKQITINTFASSTEVMSCQ